MKKAIKATSNLKEFENSVKKLKDEKYVLKLYVTGLTPQSIQGY